MFVETTSGEIIEVTNCRIYINDIYRDGEMKFVVVIENLANPNENIDPPIACIGTREVCEKYMSEFRKSLINLSELMVRIGK